MTSNIDDVIAATNNLIKPIFVNNCAVTRRVVTRILLEIRLLSQGSADEFPCPSSDPVEPLLVSRMIIMNRPRHPRPWLTDDQMSGLPW